MKKLFCIIAALAVVLSFAGCAPKETALSYDNPTGDPLFYDVRWGEDAAAILKKAGNPDVQQNNFLTYTNTELFGQPCETVLVVDFSYSYKGLFSVTHTFTGSVDVDAIEAELTTLFGQPASENFGEWVAIWEFDATVIYLSATAISFINVSV